jgi:hypothetical protein
LNFWLVYQNAPRVGTTTLVLVLLLLLLLLLLLPPPPPLPPLLAMLLDMTLRRAIYLLDARHSMNHVIKMQNDA